MSRGPGRLQWAIIREIQKTSEPVSTESLRWLLKEQGILGDRESLDLKKPANSSFQRAIKTMANYGQIIVSPRRLRNLGECVRHYPNKTLDGKLRRLRATFLPALWEWQQNGDLFPKYDTTQNEVYRLELLKRDRTGFDPLVQEWAVLKEALRPIYGSATQNADAILQLICKGTELFRHRALGSATEVSAHGSFSSALANACRKNSIPDELETRLRNFSETFMSQGTAEELNFSSYVHGMVDVIKRGTTKLRPRTLEYLHEHRKDEVEALEGFQKREEDERDIIFSLSGKKRFTYPRTLQEMIDLTIFAKFHFVTLN